MSRWCWLLVACLGCTEPAELPPSELLLADPMAGGFVLGDDSLDWSTYEWVGDRYVQTFHRREPLASEPRVIATYVADPRQRGLVGRVGDALLIGTGGSFDWCHWYGLLAPGESEPTRVPLPRTGIPDYEACWAFPLGWHGGRMVRFLEHPHPHPLFARVLRHALATRPPARMRRDAVAYHGQA